MKLSANLGFLWTELDLLDAIRAAGDAGFQAVEFHWPYVTHAVDVALATEAAGLPIVTINTVGGDLARGEFGVAALPKRDADARAAVDKALAYGTDVSAAYIHVLAGIAEGKAAEHAYFETLTYACERASRFDMGVLIEPINRHDQPGYFLDTLDRARHAITTVDAPNLRLLFDCYHVGRTEGNVAEQLERHRDLIGHIQIASVPDRHEPDRGDVDYDAVLARLEALGYEGFVGAEYRPAKATAAGLGWMKTITGKPAT